MSMVVWTQSCCPHGHASGWRKVRSSAWVLIRLDGQSRCDGGGDCDDIAEAVCVAEAILTDDATRTKTTVSHDITGRLFSLTLRDGCIDCDQR